MKFTGERFVPEVHGSIQLEHLHRYILACKAVAGKSVLDIASGEGYGSAMLARTALKVTGVDISQEAVSHAQARYQIENLDFCLGSCSAIPLEDASVDVVVSFETIEHHDEHEAMMREIKGFYDLMGLSLFLVLTNWSIRINLVLVIHITSKNCIVMNLKKFWICISKSIVSMGSELFMVPQFSVKIVLVQSKVMNLLTTRYWPVPECLMQFI